MGEHVNLQIRFVLECSTAFSALDSENLRWWRNRRSVKIRVIPCVIIILTSDGGSFRFFLKGRKFKLIWRKKDRNDDLFVHQQLFQGGRQIGDGDRWQVAVHVWFHRNWPPGGGLIKWIFKIMELALKLAPCLIDLHRFSRSFLPFREYFFMKCRNRFWMLAAFGRSYFSLCLDIPSSTNFIWEKYWNRFKLEFKI